MLCLLMQSQVSSNHCSSADGTLRKKLVKHHTTIEAGVTRPQFRLVSPASSPPNDHCTPERHSTPLRRSSYEKIGLPVKLLKSIVVIPMLNGHVYYNFSTPARKNCTCLSMPFLLGPPMASLFSTLFSKLNTLSITSGSNLSDSSRYCSKVISDRLHFCFSAKATARPEMWWVSRKGTYRRRVS